MNPLENVREGMRVVDADGEEIGTVDEYKMGDPGAVTTEGQTAPQGGGVSNLLNPFGGNAEPHANRQRAEQLVRLGYVKIDGKGLFGGKEYVTSEEVDRVEGDTVHLKPTRHVG